MKKIVSVFIFFLTFSAHIAADEQHQLNVEVLAKTDKSWNGDLLPAYPKGQPEVTILKIAIPAGSKLAMHKHPVINAGVLTKGKLTVTTTDNKILHLVAGDSIVEIVNRWHFGENEGQQPAEIIVFYAGIKGQPITVK